MYAKKSLGQHFLMHARIAERMVMVSGVTNKDTVLEIGPGKGLLTRILLAHAKKVIAIETDSVLIPILQETFATEIADGRLEVLHEDVRNFKSEHIQGSYKLVANIPYYITGEIIRQFLTETHKPDSMTLLVQKEVAERVARSKKESLLSLSVKAFGTPKYEFTVPKGAFVPAPTIDSAVLTIKSIHSQFKNSEQESHFFEILHAGFAHKRKQLGKNLESVTSGEQVKNVFETINLKVSVRAEDLPLQTWFSIAEHFTKDSRAG